jgi:hypothetical protein
MSPVPNRIEASGMRFRICSVAHTTRTFPDASTGNLMHNHQWKTSETRAGKRGGFHAPRSHSSRRSASCFAASGSTTSASYSLRYTHP